MDYSAFALRQNVRGKMHRKCISRYTNHDHNDWQE